MLFSNLPHHDEVTDTLPLESDSLLRLFIKNLNFDGIFYIDS